MAVSPISASGTETPLGAVELALQFLEPRSGDSRPAIEPRAQERDAVSVMVDLGLEISNLMQRAHDANSDTE